MNSHHHKKGNLLIVPAIILFLVFAIACGSSTNSNSSTKRKYTVGGTVTGLSGTLILQNNGGNTLSVSANGSFTFSSPLEGGTAYRATVLAQPSGQFCTITNGSGTIGSANVANILVTCAGTHAVGGTVSNLQSGVLMIQNNGRDNLSITANGSFTFNTPLADGTTYSVTISSPPSGQVCTTTNGSGTIQSANVTNVQISCYVSSATSSVNIMFPPAVSMTYGDTAKVLGTTSGSEAFTEVQVNGVAATSKDGFKTWEADVPLRMGSNDLIAVGVPSAQALASSTWLKNGRASTTPKSGNVAFAVSADSDAVVISRVMSSNESIALDRAHNRILIADRFSKAIFTVDISTGATGILSDNKTPNSQNPFDVPIDIAVDSANNRALVADTNGHAAVVAVDLETGARSILSDSSTSVANPFSGPIAIAIDSANNRALVTDQALDVVIAVNLGTGSRTVLSGNGHPDNQNPFTNAIDIAIDSANNRALVVNQNPTVLMSVNLDTGARTILSDFEELNAAGQAVLVHGVAIDDEGNRALVTNLGVQKSVFAVNLATGAHSIISSNSASDEDNPLVSPKGIIIDAENSRALIADDGRNILLTMDLNTGARSIFLEATIPDNVNPFIFPSGVAMNDANNRVLVVDEFRNGLIAVDLETGTRSTLSDNTTPNDFTPFFDIGHGIAVDSAHNRALVSSFGHSRVIAVDLSTGVRSVFLPDITPYDTPLEHHFFPSGIAIDSANNQALVVDSANRAVIAVDLDSGLHKTLSDNTFPNSNNPFDYINFGIAVDSARNRALLVDSGRGAVVAVDLSTGARSTLSESESPGYSDISGGIVIDSANNRALVAGGGPALKAVDLDTGVRSIVSDCSSQDAVNPMRWMYGLALDPINNRIFMTDRIIGALFMIDPESGERVILSK